MAKEKEEDEQAEEPGEGEEKKARERAKNAGRRAYLVQGTESKVHGWLQNEFVGKDVELNGEVHSIAGVSGRGGSAVVFRAFVYTGGTRTQRAIKVFYRVEGHFCPANEFRNALLVSAHPNAMVPLFVCEVGTSRGPLCCIAMEYYRGDLFNAVQSNRLPEDRAFAYFAQLMSVIFYMHDQGLVHKDVKLENLMVDDKGALRLVDMGYAQAFDTCTGRHLNEASACCGSPFYTSPDVFRGAYYHPTEHDVWGAFACLFVMATGYMPFRGRGEELVRNILHCEIDNPVTHSEELSSFPRQRVLSDGMFSFLQRGMCKDRKTRLCRREDILKDPWVITMCSRASARGAVLPFPFGGDRTSSFTPSPSVTRVPPSISEGQGSVAEPSAARRDGGVRESNVLVFASGEATTSSNRASFSSCSASTTGCEGSAIENTSDFDATTVGLLLSNTSSTINSAKDSSRSDADAVFLEESCNPEFRVKRRAIDPDPSSWERDRVAEAEKKKASASGSRGGFGSALRRVMGGCVG